MKKSLLLISVLQLVFFFHHLYAQSDELSFEHLSMKDGLSMNPVLSIAQDNKGFLWFGTPDGLNRFDGYKFVIYKSQDDTTSISDNYIACLFTDKYGKIWIGTHNGGLNQYNHNSGRFIRFQYAAENKNMLNSNRVWSIYGNDQDELWIGTDKGLNLIDAKTGQFLDYASKYPALKSVEGMVILYIYQDQSGIFWMGTTTGLIRYKHGQDELRIFNYDPQDKNSLSDNIVLTVFEDSKHNIYVGTIDGLNLYQPSKENFTNYKFTDEETFKANQQKSLEAKLSFTLTNNYTTNTVRTILEDKNHNLWIGTDRGLKIFDPSTGNYTNYLNEANNPKSLNHNMIRSIFQDQTDNLWIGTVGAGLNKINLKPKKFQHFQKKLTNPYSLSENYIRSLCEDNSGNIWIGTILGGLNRLDPVDGKYYHYKKEASPSGSSINDNNVWFLLFDTKGLLWIGTNKGLNKYDPKTTQFSYYIHNEKNAYSITENTVRSIFEDSKGNLWIGTEGGLNKFDYVTDKFKRYRKSDLDNNSISDNTIWKIVETKTGDIWLGTNDGLNKLNPQTDQFTHFRKQHGNRNSLSHNSIRTLYIDKYEIIWVGTESGLNKFDPVKEIFTRYDEISGLPSSFIYGILGDDKGNLWMSTNLGIYEFNPSSATAKNYDIYDGVQDYEFNTNACYKNKAGEMFFGGPNGYNRFHPKNIYINQKVSPVVITGIKVMDRLIKLDQDISEVRELTLGHDQNILYFEFSSLDFTNPSRNQYAYMMDGFNKDWIYSGNTRSITYTNLDPGDYIFRFKGTNSDGIWNEEDNHIKISIFPPFWDTKWFYFLMILSFVVITYIVYRLRVRSLKLEKNKLELNVKERTRELDKKNQELETINLELEQLSLVACQTDNTVLITNAEGEVIYINPSFSNINNGVTLEELKQQRGKTIYETSNNPHIREIINDCVNNKKSIVYESLNNRVEGKEIWESSTLTPIFDHDGKLHRLIIVDTDITLRKETEELVKQKNKDITDSINYAKRIQNAILSDEVTIRKALPDSFVFLQPKDIVSGDFYWFNQLPSANGSEVIIAACDCTGHGVPGAFMSMIGNDILTQIIIEKRVTKPSEVLSQLNKGIKYALKQSGAESETRDGMDIAFCLIDKNSKSVQFAGAQRSLVYIHEGQITEIKADKTSIGGITGENYPFNNHRVILSKGDVFYMFSDGYTDQFGESSNKKFTTKRLKELLLFIHAETMDKQKEILAKTINDWRGNFFQTDDILVIGVKF